MSDVLLLRQREDASQTIEGTRGMPLGLPSLTPEDVQLVETWIAQGPSDPVTCPS